MKFWQYDVYIEPIKCSSDMLKMTKKGKMNCFRDANFFMCELEDSLKTRNCEILHTDNTRGFFNALDAHKQPFLIVIKEGAYNDSYYDTVIFEKAICDSRRTKAALDLISEINADLKGGEVVLKSGVIYYRYEYMQPCGVNSEQWAKLIKDFIDTVECDINKAKEMILRE